VVVCRTSKLQLGFSADFLGMTLKEVNLRSALQTQVDILIASQACGKRRPVLSRTSVPSSFK
jgi:hypothetical protein